MPAPSLLTRAAAHPLLVSLALFVVGLPLVLGSGWLWVNLGHWPAWYIYGTSVPGWVLLCAVFAWRWKREGRPHG